METHRQVRSARLITSLKNQPRIVGAIVSTVLAVAVALALVTTQSASGASSSGLHSSIQSPNTVLAAAKKFIPVGTTLPRAIPAAVTITVPPTTAAPVTAPPTTVAPAPRPAPVVVPAPRPAPAPAPVAAQGRCGGYLPPCWVMNRESGGNIRAKNRYSSASGKWQILDSTWAGYGGYSSAMYAPESVQDSRAAQIWAGGRGCSAWSAC